MSDSFQFIVATVKNCNAEPNFGSLSLPGAVSDCWPFLFDYFEEKEHPLFKRSHLLVYSSTDSAEQAFKSLSQCYPEKTLYFPGQEIDPYESTLPSENILYRQFCALSQLSLDKRSWLIVTTLEASLLKVPLPTFFINNSFSLSAQSLCPPLELSHKLVERGYSSCSGLEEPGTFSRRGEVFDIFPICGRPIRMYYFDDTIEEIFPILPTDNTTLREQQIQSLAIHPSPRIFSRPQYSQVFKESLPRFSAQHMLKHRNRMRIFELLKEDYLFENYPFFLPLFFKQTASLVDYLDNPVVTFANTENSRNFWDELLNKHHQQANNVSNSNIAPHPEKLYHKILPLQHEKINVMEETFHSAQDYLKENIISKKDIKKMMHFLEKEFCEHGHIIFTTPHQNAKKEMQHLLELFDDNNDLKKKLSYRSFPLKSGFFYPTEKVLVLTEADILTSKKMTSSEKQNPVYHQDIFAEQMASLKKGDYIIHAKHGLGQFLGLESFDFNRTTPTDFIAILYQDSDKVYVPVYRFDLIQKYADSEQSFALASLKSRQFANVKKNAKKSAKELAFNLLELQAKRETSKSFAFSPPDEIYKEFESSFPFRETQDQLRAIDSVLKDMQQERPMDRLICGDVGFGKTEVAIRASFKAVSDKKQVAILVPTTILALQHYVNFVERFKDFSIKIDFLSRFKSPKEVKYIKEQLEFGEIDILIGTHKLLSKDIRFFDLGLVIIDEEQRFGVNHKEKLKLLRNSVDFLTLSATPIPRTLQLAFLGLKDISLIQTPPPRRQSIKSYVTKEDEQTIKNAIEKEIQRGGQVFVVHNRVKDIELYKEFIQKLVPRTKIIVAHGQLSEKELEERIKSFYSGEYQILVSTTIIENGIDMPNVNTLIVNRADRYGLSQLHQLRGRIGRSDKKAYAYFIVPKNLNPKAASTERLNVLQKYAEIGSGFHIASSDLDLRGGGDILGAQQAGHVEEVGLELYTQLLKEAINELKGGHKIVKRDIEINTPFHSFIPQHYIEDDSERLKYYKKLSNAENLKQLEHFSSQLEDIFGPLPEELKTLITLLQCRLIVQNIGLKYLNIVGNNIILHFDKKILAQNPYLTDRITEAFLHKIPSCQISPDYSVTHRSSQNIDVLSMLNFCQSISQKIAPSEASPP